MMGRGSARPFKFPYGGTRPGPADQLFTGCAAARPGPSCFLFSED